MLWLNVIHVSEVAESGWLNAEWSFETLLGPLGSNFSEIYSKTSIISHTLLDNKLVDHSVVIGASPVGAAPKTSSFST